jgi:bacterioferritin-associated ferredoxin
MDPDQKLCLCFHVSLRKVQKFIRLEKPKVASQLSQCYGAGTGCGWCRPFLKKLLDEAQSVSADRSADLSIEAPAQTDSQNSPQSHNSRVKSVAQLDPIEYASLREQYVREGKGTPPR